MSQTDSNGKITTTDYRNHSLTTNPASPVNDPFLRPGLVTDPAGRKVSTFYHDSLRQVETKADLKIADDALLKTMSTHDKLGRVTKVESSEDGTSYSISSKLLIRTIPFPG